MSLMRWSGLGGKVNRLRKWFLYGPRGNTLSYVRRMNGLGASIDESLFMPTPESVFLDDTTPWLMEIGENVFLAAGVKILTHDASWLAMKSEDGVVRGHMAPVRIGNNVFIGMNSIVLCGVNICDNVIVGTNSVVDTSICTPGVYVGNPARLVAPYERFKALREGRQLKEAYALAARYFRRFGEKPPQEVFHEYFWLFAPRDVEALPPAFLQQMREQGGFERSRRAFLASEPEFDGYDAFWGWCQERMRREERKRS